MQLYDAGVVQAALNWPDLIAAIEQHFAAPVEVPQRQVLTIANPKGENGVLLLMPAWLGGDSIGVKAVTFFPGNTAKGISTISAAYLLFDGETGAIRAAMDGDAITVRRTAATSAAAAKRLARTDARRLLVIGTGQLSEHMASAHAAVRVYESIEIHGRDPAKASAVAGALRRSGLAASVALDLEASVCRADVISCCTSASTPLFPGAWLQPGCHVDLVGSFKDDMREVDDEAVRRSAIFVDAKPGALLSGDLAQPLRDGVINEGHILADLADLVSGRHPGRGNAAMITLFKSVGNAREDLAAARLIAETRKVPG
ncbi:MAG TPA: ornithine cyclodeaminase family protein [Beijerinckiaceae bacterium]|nr:ornithine cyclodeaminase family protein [Beijerinckiaceae bacterium]